MLSNLDCSILKELDRQNIKSDVISVVMNRLDTNDKKNDGESKSTVIVFY